MTVELSKDELEALIESVKYSVERVTNARDTPEGVRNSARARRGLMSFLRR